MGQRSGNDAGRYWQQQCSLISSPPAQQQSTSSPPAADQHVAQFTATACLARVLPQITVDGDTSTNDTVIGLASGKSGAPLIGDADSADGKALEAALTALLQVSRVASGTGPTCTQRTLG